MSGSRSEENDKLPTIGLGKALEQEGPSIQEHQTTEPLIIYEHRGIFFYHSALELYRISPNRLAVSFEMAQFVNGKFYKNGNEFIPPAVVRNRFLYNETQIREDCWGVVYHLYGENYHEGVRDPWNGR